MPDGEQRNPSHSPAPAPTDGLPAGYPFRPTDEVSPRSLRHLIGCAAPEALAAPADPPVFLLDVRTPPEREICSIKGSRLYPLQSLEARLDDLKAEVDDDLARPIVVYCHHGRRSLTATYILRAAGFSDVRSLAGGIDLWSRDIDPSVPTY
jgi:rhodanese-related sulfurtransferase